MGKKPAKPVAKKARRAVPAEKPTPKPRKAPVEASSESESTTAPDNAKRYVDARMKEWAQTVDFKKDCYVWMPVSVNIAHALEWAAYWQPRLGTEIRLVWKTGKPEQPTEYLVIDHLSEKDPFPQRAFNYPWKVSEQELIAQGKSRWAISQPITKPATVDGVAIEPEAEAEADAQPEATDKPAAAAPQAGKTTRRTPPPETPAPQPRAPAKAPPGKGAETKKAPAKAAPGTRPNPRPGTKAFDIVAACERKEGATRADLMKANAGTWPGDAYLRKLAGIAKLDLSQKGDRWFMTERK